MHGAIRKHGCTRCLGRGHSTLTLAVCLHEAECEGTVLTIHAHLVIRISKQNYGENVYKHLQNRPYIYQHIDISVEICTKC